ncbi:MAG: BPL-N domain-containing protein [Candidatus Thorarchaeota archaeon]
MQRKAVVLGVILILGVASIGFIAVMQFAIPPNPLSSIRIACYNGEGVMEEDLIILPNLAAWIGCEYEEISGQSIIDGNLTDFDVLTLPGGNGPVYWNDLGSQGQRAIQEFVNQGGGYLGICEGAYRACESAVWTDSPENLILNDSEAFLGFLPAVAWGPVFEIAERPEPGWGMAAIDIVDNTHPITIAAPERMTMYYQGGPYLNFTDDNGVTILGTYNATGEPAIASCEYGEGRVFISGPHPELEEDEDRDGIQFYEQEGDLWDPESDWPLLKDAIAWLCELDGTQPNQAELVISCEALVSVKRE